METYTVGFVFDENMQQVLLVHKRRPEWQAGQLNGVGGRAENDETIVECMARECLEETCLNIPADRWSHFATIINTGGRSPDPAQIEFYTATYSGPITDAQKGDHEEIEWFDITTLPGNCIQNLYFMIPMARETLLGHNSKEITITY